jgi:murein DD-endopeptidase MepM/ murein hydrolase activator NlpD
MLELFYPVKPLKVNQAFGIFNPAYEKFGFNRHNGIDYATTHRQPVYSMCDGVVTEVKNYPSGAGKAVRVRTLSPVEAEGVNRYAEFMYMHADEVKVVEGQKVKAGDLLTFADNTGFSTGTHLHISAYFVDPAKQTAFNKLKVGDETTDYCFDFSKYYNGYYAADATKVFGIFNQIISLLKAQIYGK